MVEAGLTAAGFKSDPNVHEIFTKYRKSHNDGVFDTYTPEIMNCRKSGAITGLPDSYGRGRIIGDYRRVADPPAAALLTGLAIREWSPLRCAHALPSFDTLSRKKLPPTDRLRVRPGRIRSTRATRAKYFLAEVLQSAQKAGGLMRGGSRSTGRFGGGGAAPI